MFDSLSQQLQQAETECLGYEQRDRQRRLQAVQAHQDYIAEQKRALIARHPEMADPVNGRRETAALTRYLIDTGYRQEELSRLVDHRDFILARKAMLFDRLMANREKIKETVAALPRVQKPGTARGSRTGAAERRAKLMTRLERSGRTEDAARLTAHAKSTYLDAVRDWVRSGARSEHAFTAEQARAHLPAITTDVATAQAMFRLGQVLLRRGERAEAERWLEEASRLHPDSWCIWRQSAGVNDQGLAALPDFWERVDALGANRYYLPVDMKGMP